MERYFEPDDLIQLWAITASQESPSLPEENRMKDSMTKMIASKDDEPEDTISPEKIKVSQKVEKMGGGAPFVFRFHKLLKMLVRNKQFGDLKTRILCHRCEKPPVEPMVTNCYHVHCKDCLEIMSMESSARDENWTPCSKCGKIFGGSWPCEISSDLTLASMTKSNEKTNAKAGEQERPSRNWEDNMRWVDFGGDDVLPSTKTTAVVERLDEWLTGFPDQKIIVFSQFHVTSVLWLVDQSFRADQKSSMQVIARMCQQRKWGYVPVGSKSLLIITCAHR